MSLKKITVVFVVLLLILAAVPMAVAAGESAEDVKAMLTELPAPEDLADMSAEDQRLVYDRVQAAYEAYQALPEEEQNAIEGAQDQFQGVFDYFNAQVMPLDAAAEEEAPAEEKEEGIPWAVTAMFLALITTFLQNKFIHGRR